MLDKGRRRLRKGGGGLSKIIKRGWNRKDRRRNRELKKKGWQAGSRAGCLKKAGDWNPLTNYATFEETS